ncbi:hypothetical protein, partial [Methanosarcina sp. UBA5]|uniref:hypothetical protein n=1 Tax=Methanosarcina sp. UBA5 TaxID=1915593 RepID=UPI0025E233FD
QESIMLCLLRTKAIQISVAFPSKTSGRVTTSPARDFDVISGKSLPMILLPIFLESKSCL